MLMNGSQRYSDTSDGIIIPVPALGFLIDGVSNELVYSLDSDVS